MIELKDELFAIPVYKCKRVPIMVNHHKWWLVIYRLGYNGDFGFEFESPKKRRYFFRAKLGKHGGRVTEAAVVLANGEMVANYHERWGDSPEKMDAVIRLTPKHVLDRLFTLLDAIG